VTEGERRRDSCGVKEWRRPPLHRGGSAGAAFNRALAPEKIMRFNDGGLERCGSR
jgi:hypothetical protein